MAIKNCNTNNLAGNSPFKHAKTTARYKIDKNIVTLVKDSWPQSFNKRNQRQIIKLLKTITRDKKNKIWSKSQLRSLFRNYDKRGIINKLNDAEYYLLLDLLEQPILSANGQTRVKEKVALLNSTNTFSTEIYQAFITLAQKISNKATPNILVITASARDPFEAVDFYQAAFTQAGGDTQWLPLDATLNHTFQQTGDRSTICQQLSTARIAIQGSINREYVYPDLVRQQLVACLNPKVILEKIAQADGIFINGGDQSLTLKAFVNQDGSDSKALQLIKDKLANNSLIIGGTSAGTAVMSGGSSNSHPIPMITNGQSNTALVRGAKRNVLPQEGCQKSQSCSQDLLNDDLTYNDNGGLGLFTWGVMDTHFSERGRQGRLAKLVLDTNTRFAFGVDEATALIVSNLTTEHPTFKVLGQSGVFVIENTKQVSRHAANSEAKENTKADSVLSHYLTRDDVATLNNQHFSVKIAPWKDVAKEPAAMPAAIPATIDDIFEGERYKLAAELLCRTASQHIAATSEWRQRKHAIEVSKPSNSQSGYGVFSRQGNEQGYCSYQNYQLSISAAKGSK